MYSFGPLIRPSAATVILLFTTGCNTQTPSAPAAFDESAGHWVDLSHSFSHDTIYWPTDSLGFRLEQLAYGETPGGYFYSAYRFSTAEHGGTHLDAPIHFAEGGLTVDAIPLEQLIGPAVVVDVPDGADADYLVSVDDLTAFEQTNGEIPTGAMVLLRTGWGSRWDDRTSYLGTPLAGQAAIPELHFPGLAPEAAQWLVDNRDVGAVGIDTPSIDYGQSSDFAAHVILNGASIPALENVANLDQLPATGAFVVALPMKIADGSGAPIRIAAYVSNAYPTSQP
jgi:kynurenine formamidase